jgi:hypothetical protein
MTICRQSEIPSASLAPLSLQASPSCRLKWKPRLGKPAIVLGRDHSLFLLLAWRSGTAADSHAVQISMFAGADAAPAHKREGVSGFPVKVGGALHDLASGASLRRWGRMQCHSIFLSRTPGPPPFSGMKAEIRLFFWIFCSFGGG